MVVVELGTDVGGKRKIEARSGEEDQEFDHSLFSIFHISFFICRARPARNGKRLNCRGAPLV
jgi:hypothetical protein